MKYFVHDKAIVKSKSIGEGTKIWAFCNILEGARLGKNCNICDRCFVENSVSIGNNVTIKTGVSLWDGITVEDDVFIGPGVSFANDKFPRSKNTNYKQGKTILKKGCSIGANATILSGIVIGKSAMVGAGAVVTKDVPDFALVYGNPARVMGKVDEGGKKIIEE